MAGGKKWQDWEYEADRQNLLGLMADQRFKDWPAAPPELRDQLLAMPGKSIPEWARDHLTDAGWSRLLETLRNRRRTRLYPPAPA